MRQTILGDAFGLATLILIILAAACLFVALGLAFWPIGG